MASHKCIIQDDKTTCHELCKTCSNSSFCGNLNACTSCFPGDYKISEFFDDLVFQCSKVCDGFSYQLNDYWFCDKSFNNFPVDKIVKNINVNDVTQYSETYGYNIIVICICVGGAFVGVAIFTIFKRRCRKHTADNFKTLESGLSKPLKFPQQCEKEEGILKMIRDVQSFKTGKYLGGGSYSKVYEGILKNSPVAIKIALKNGRKSFYKELQIYDKVSHPNILQAFGVHFGIENMLFLGLRKSNLKHYLLNYGKNVGFEKLRQYSIQIADGMKYLHNKRILHCDLKIDNILIKDKSGENLEISDFGCAIDLEHDHELKFNGTITHMAYKLLKKSINANYSATASKASDVWSFAVTIWQIFQKSDKLPSDFIKVGDIIANHENGKKLPKPVLLPEIIWRYNLLRCFDLDPNSRPSMDELCKTLTSK